MLGEALAAEAAEKQGTVFPEVANFITLLYSLGKEVPFIEALHHFENVVFSWIIILILAIMAFLATRKPGPLQNAVEMVVEALDNFVCTVLGPHGRRYTPFIGTLFLYIWSMNMAGIVPLLKSPSSNLNTTLSLAIMVILYVQYRGIAELGVIGYIDHLLGRPRNLVGWLLSLLMLPLHIMEELIRVVSLSLRLFGNISGEDALIASFVTYGVAASSVIGIPIGLPFQVPIMLLAILMGTIQALVFSLLSTVYLSLMLSHEEGHGEEKHH